MEIARDSFERDRKNSEKELIKLNCHVFYFLVDFMELNLYVYFHRNNIVRSVHLNSASRDFASYVSFNVTL